MANHLKELQMQKLEELKTLLDKDELQQYYDTHTYKETAEHYRKIYGCSIKNLKLLFNYFNIKRKGRGDNLTSKNREKLKQAIMAKYGVDNLLKSKEVQERIVQTNLKRYGVKNVFQNPKIRAKQKATCLQRYGVENVFQAEEIKKIIRQTCLDRYGVEHVSECPEIIKKSKQTKLNKYGDSGYHNFEQMKQTNLKKYGTEIPTQNPKVVEKIKATCLEKYGVDNPAKLLETHVKMAETRSNVIANDGQVFDSHWEVMVYEYAKQKGYFIERNIPIKYAENHITFIDFKINGILYEVKGTHLLNDCWAEKGVLIENKINCYKQHNIYIITDTSKITLDPELNYIDIYNLNF